MRRSHRAANLLHLGQQELDGGKLVRPPPVVSEAWRRETILIAYVRIEVDRLIGVREIFGLCDDCAVAREIFCKKVAISRAPTRSAGRRIETDGCPDRAGLEVSRTN